MTTLPLCYYHDYSLYKMCSSILADYVMDNLCMI
jgi:hypothetical protein